MTVRADGRPPNSLGQKRIQQIPLSDLASFRARSDSATPIAGR